MTPTHGSVALKQKKSYVLLEKQRNKFDGNILKVSYRGKPSVVKEEKEMKPTRTMDH